ncbi:MAG: KamA family radical SAM protein [Candidatus Nanoarchaeia archaeon]|nr:KamA family radical SAM protein [Candidatus Nanoarchaeia archaeon]MDD5358075.1 KamA family radical SAM protein [Candidatus Nanoarchaeia archaeon]MDD5589263.1 KamA family radical SAM protein [Candidatus Nanoarchaeia archaeon]
MNDNSASVAKSEDEPPNPAIEPGGIVSADQVSGISKLNKDNLKKIFDKYPVRITNYYFSLIKEKDDGVYKQCIPSMEEISDLGGEEDPLNEEPEHQVRQGVPSLLTHRYPDRVLFRISNSCAMYCRFCTRKRKVGDVNKQPTWKEIGKALLYIQEHGEIRDVILSGGDPLMLPDKTLDKILAAVYLIISKRENGIIRIGTRIPCVLPQRITQELCDVLKKYHPIYLNTHFNHPNEITTESKRACGMLADAGIPVGNQTVLLKGVNDNPEIMKELMQRLISIRVRPYYIYQCDPVRGANHFRTRVEKGLEIYKALRGHTSGLCVPHFVIDAPGGGGKIPLLPEYLQTITDEKVVMKNYEEKEFEYIQAD